MIALNKLLHSNNIHIDVELTSANEVFSFIGDLFETQLELAPSTVQSCLKDRETLGSTGLGHGIAIPHGRVKNLKEPHLGFIRLKNGIDFKAPDQEPVSVFVIMLVPEEATQMHLEILSQVAQILSNKETKDLLFTEANKVKIYELLTTLKK
jgi:PTS system nitrogen regulatory IIA component